MSDTAETNTTPGPEVAVITLAEEPSAWAAAGFAVEDDGICRLGHVTVELVGRQGAGGVVGWSLRGVPEGAPDNLDGFPTRATDRERAVPVDHPSSAVAVDHIVLLSDDLERTVEAAAAVGLTPRRWRDHVLPDGTEARQAFFRAGQVVLEVVAPRTTPADPRPGVRPFGLAVTALDIDQARTVLGDDLGPVRKAVQPGRFIATLRRSADGLATPLALMSPPPRRPPAPPTPPEGAAQAPPAGAAPAPPTDGPTSPAPQGAAPDTSEPVPSAPEDGGPEPTGPFAIPG